MSSASLDDLVEAVRDLTRVVIATQGNFATRADAIRRLYDLAIPPARIAAILAIPSNAVHSTLTKAKQKADKGGDLAQLTAP
jgi:DNA-directed RNA polymerase specialized sigma24 family protein